MNHLWRVNEVEIRKFDIGLMDFESPLNALQLWTPEWGNRFGIDATTQRESGIKIDRIECMWMRNGAQH